MSKYYNAKRTRNIYNPEDQKPFRLSRSKIDLFLECPRCFYLDRRLGVGRPPGYPFSLNSAVDTLLKKEFDSHRVKGSMHPLMEKYGIDAIPFKHKNMDLWRDALKGGVSYNHPETNFQVTGAVDDIWVDRDQKLIVVDYKATAKEGEVGIDAEWQISYKRQMEIYQWLLRKNGFKVSDIGYFVYVNGRTDVEAFDGRLEFDVRVIPYTGDDAWVEKTLLDAYECLLAKKPPNADPDCDYCAYQDAVAKSI